MKAHRRIDLFYFVERYGKALQKNMTRFGKSTFCFVFQKTLLTTLFSFRVVIGNTESEKLSAQKLSPTQARVDFFSSPIPYDFLFY